ncbi:protein SSUH2 homolog isoform 1-T1 [Odontesthes bonariensis]|uniref:protein SSUH2 homolog isoform X1 n=2 Tax=Odontesthes bonariensis TaxID=219752 RepID=UPI003F5877EA
MSNAAVYPPPSAPPANMFGNVPGYEGIAAGGGGYLPPPMPAEPIAPPQPGPAPADWSIPSLSEDVAREAFISFASSHCCYRSDPATDGVITNMEPCNTFRYRLETFTESRSTEWAHKPHEGEQPDFYTQTAPQPWEVRVTPPNLFTNHKEEIRVPYTSSLKECHSCHAQGTMACKECQGNGYKPCFVCNGTGTKNDETCTRCNASGKDRCSDCDAHGTKKCDTCGGKRQLLTYIQLKVEWTNHVEDHLVEQNSGLTVDDLHSVSGKELFKNNQYLVYPLLGFPNPAIAQVSERLVKEHQSKHAQNSRILQQRQTVELIPITKVNYKWKADMHVYFVYGNEHKVSASNYPATCCCCVIM